MRSRGLDGRFELFVDTTSSAHGETCALETSREDGGRLTATSGRDARGRCWDVDWYGDARANASSGSHLSSMQTWVRTNQWNHGARALLRVKTLATGLDASRAVREYGARFEESGARERRAERAPKKNRAPRGRREEDGRAFDHAPKCATSVYAMTVLDGGKIGARVFVDESTKKPWRAEFYHQRGVETWTFEEWDDVKLDDGTVASTPSVARRKNSEGQITVYLSETTTATTDGDASFAMPASTSTSERSWSSESSTLSAVRGDGGHVLVKATLESGDEGWFVLDTASTGLVIAPWAADSCSMPSFGSMAVASIAAPLEGALRRSREISIGSFRMMSPIFMEQNLDGALRVPDGQRLTGVLGVPALAHSIVCLHAPMRVPGSRDAPKLTVEFHDPESYVPSGEIERAWQDVTFIDGVPHVQLAYTVANDGFKGVTAMTDERVGLFKLSLGTGGTGAVLSARVAKEAELAERTKALQPGGVMSGPGESAGRLQRVGDEIVTGRMETIRFKGFEFKNVRAVVHLDGDPPDADISPHADGAVCVDLFRGCELVLDLRNTQPRVAVVPP